jgi:hypothetical protein
MVVGIGHVARRWRRIVRVVHFDDGTATVQRRGMVRIGLGDEVGRVMGRGGYSGRGRLFTVVRANRRGCDVESGGRMRML